MFTTSSKLKKGQEVEINFPEEAREKSKLASELHGKSGKIVDVISREDLLVEVEGRIMIFRRDSLKAR